LSKTSEKEIEKRLREEVENLGGMALKLLPFENAGLPDRMCLFPGGVLIFVELKSTGDKPRKLQRLMFSKIRKRGFRVEIIDTITGVMDLIEEFK
jgi:hypothetical protein